MASRNSQQEIADDERLKHAGYSEHDLSEMDDEAKKAALTAIAENETTASESSEDPNKPKRTAKTKFYKSIVAGLHIRTGSVVDDSGFQQPQYARFRPYIEAWQGGERKVGYLETDNKDLQKRLESDPNVSELSEDRYDEELAQDKTRATVL